MNIDPISRLYGPQLKKAVGKANPAEKPAKVAGDSVALSPQALEMQRRASEMESVSNRMTEIPDIRPEKVTETREKIASGYYNSPEFTEKLADKLLKAFGLRD